MTKKINTVAAGLLLLSLTMGLAGSAAASETEPQLDKATSVKAVKSLTASAMGGIFMAHPSGFGLLSNPVHERNYLKLMVKAYSPENEQVWNVAFEERKQVEAQFRKALTITFQSASANGLATISTSGPATISATAVGATQEPLTEANTINNIQAGDKKPQVTFIQKDQVFVTEAHNIPLGAPLQNVIIRGEQAMTMSASPQAKLQGDFIKAVDTADASTITALLPKLLEVYKQTTDNLTKSIEQQKQFQAAASIEATPAVEASK